jgi:regulator of extracellular matrix RemA (YlzA/DUF370 family)
MDNKLIHIAFNNYVSVDRIIAIATPKSAPIKRSIQEARDRQTLIDLTDGHRTKSVIFTDSNYIVLSALESYTLDKRIKESTWAQE